MRVVPSAAGAGAVTAATVVNMMNSYFEQGGFYGQTAGTAATASPADQAAYRFPLGLGMGVNPYSQHNAAAAAAAARPQDSAYAAAAAAAAEIAASGGVGQTSPKSNSLYSPLSDSSSYKAPNSATAASAPPPNNSAASTGSSNNSVSSAGIAGSNDCKDQNGYSSLSKDVVSAANSTSLNSQSAAAAAAAASSWSSSGGGGGSSGGNHVTPPPRPSADTPDHMSRYTPTAADVAARERWMNTCSLTQSAAAAQQQMHAQASSANHTFYPWMAIAGKEGDVDDIDDRDRPDVSRTDG